MDLLSQVRRICFTRVPPYHRSQAFIPAAYGD